MALFHPKHQGGPERQWRRVRQGSRGVVTVTNSPGAEPAGVAFDRPHSGGVGGEFEGAPVQGPGELGRESGKVGRGRVQQAADGAIVADAEAVVEVLVRGVRGGRCQARSRHVAGTGRPGPAWTSPCS